MATRVENPFEVAVSQNAMKAYISCTQKDGYDSVDPGVVMAALEEAGIATNDRINSRIQAFAEVLEFKGPPSEPFEIASGREPIEGVDARFIWEQEYEDLRHEHWKVQGASGFFPLDAFTTVEEGFVFGELVPKIDAVEGVDVHGNAVPCQTVVRDLIPGSGVEIVPNGMKLLANVSGKVEIKDGMISVVQCELISSNVGAEMEALSKETALIISGTVRRNVVESGGSITVKGGIEDADVSAAGHVVSAAGISGVNQCRVSAGCDILARFCENAQLRAGGDIHIVTAVENCQLYALGSLRMSAGVLTGGTCYVQSGITADVIGCNAGDKTVIRAGIRPDLLYAVAQKDLLIQEKMTRVHHIRKMVTPLMEQYAQLTPEQREKAAELLSQADLAEADIRDQRAEQQRMLQNTRPEASACLEVRERIYCGTSICLNDCLFVCENDMKGPVRLSLKQRDGRVCMVADNLVTHSEKILHTRRLSLEELKY